MSMTEQSKLNQTKCLLLHVFCLSAWPALSQSDLFAASESSSANKVSVCSLL